MAASSYFFLFFPLRDLRATAMRLSGSSNMAPALRHMGWLAGLRVCGCITECVFGGCMVDASPNANACLLKNGRLSPPLFLLFGRVYFGLLVLAVIFFLSRTTERQKDAPVIHFGIQHLLIWSQGMKLMNLCVCRFEFLIFCALKPVFSFSYVFRSGIFDLDVITEEEHTHQSLLPLSLHPCNSTYCFKYVLIKFSVGLGEK